MSPERGEALQPALLDRLLQHAPGPAAGARTATRLLTRTELRAAILRDLSWLLNTVQPLPREQAAADPLVAGSVVNYGLPPLAGELASHIDVAGLERAIRDAILRFEPRLLDDCELSVRALPIGNRMDTHNVIELEIRASLFAHPVPAQVLLRTRLDLEAGQVQLVDHARPRPAGAR